MLAERVYLPDIVPGFQPGVALTGASWYAVRTRARHEKRASALLQEKRISVFLPLVLQVRRWTDRFAKVEVPLFGCYLFARTLPGPDSRLRILETPGVLGLAGAREQGTPISDAEIESLRTAIEAKAAFQPHPFTCTGQRVRVRGGALDGVEGTIAGESTDHRVVLSVEILRRSVSICVEGYDLEVI